jgi:methionine sulfoxide reductase heme-binding subunit
MATDRIKNEKQNPITILFRVVLAIIGILAVAFAVFVAGVLAYTTSLGQYLLTNLSWLFAIDSVQLWWFITRAAGIIAYLLLWFSTVWGLAVPSKLLDPLLDRMFTYDFHQTISLLSIGFLLLHVIVLTLDRYLPYSTWQILIPFLSPYRPLWVGIGVLSFYIIALVTVTFYMRGRIGMPAFRAIHTLSLAGYLGATLHGLFAGTDSSLLGMQFMYEGTALVALFLTGYWLFQRYQTKQDEKKAAIEALRQQRRRRPSTAQR